MVPDTAGMCILEDKNKFLIVEMLRGYVRRMRALDVFFCNINKYIYRMGNVELMVNITLKPI